jgi:hypothetical protein
MEEGLAAEYTLISPSIRLGYALSSSAAPASVPAVVDGNRSSNVNEIGLRLWTDRS